MMVHPLSLSSQIRRMNCQTARKRNNESRLCGR
jgi:hypothetical protein